MIKPLMLKALNEIANKSLALDPDTQKRLEEIDGHCYAVDITDWSLKLYIHIDNQQIKITDEPHPECSVTLTGPLRSFLNKLKPNSPLINQDGLQITGSLEHAQNLQNILKNMNVDWEKHWEDKLGESLGQKIYERGKGLKSWLKQVRSSTAKSTKDYLQEESQLLPGQEEVDEFCKSVTRLNEDTERLALKIQRLKTKKEQ